MRGVRSTARILLAASLLWACGGEEAEPGPDSGQPDAVADEGGADEGTSPPDEGPKDAPEQPDEGPDTAEMPSVPDVPDVPGCQVCAGLTGCGEVFDAACPAACGEGEVATCESACLAQAGGCDEAIACLGLEAELAAGPAQPWSAGPYDIWNRTTAGPFTLPTLKGELVFDESTWTGRDSYIFTFTQTGFEYTEALWQSQVFSWLNGSPPNVHYVFLAYAEPQTGQDNAQEKVAAMKARVDEAVDKLGLAYGKAVECHWRRRTHFVTTQAWGLGNWISQRMSERAEAGIAIDRFQQQRSLGLLQPVGGTPSLSHLSYEAQYYNFEFEREQGLVKEGVTEVLLYENVSTGGGSVTVELPSAAEMAGFDTLEFDLQVECPGNDESGCPEWDYKANLRVAEEAALPGNPNAETPCEPGGEDTPVEELPCDCVDPLGQVRQSKQLCNAEGTGFSACECNGGVEIARWITTYAREGRWVSDSTPLLPLLDAGGEVRFLYNGGNTYITRLSLRLYDGGKPDRPATVTPLFTGKTFNEAYNEGYEPLEVQIPAGTARAELFAWITGHGFGVDVANCAEFCNHTHHFTVGGHETVHAHPEAGTFSGCAAQVPDGTVPNQFGTWTLGRGGWCPGMDVKPFRADVSEHVTPGAPVTVDYEGRLEGEPYVPEPYQSPNGGFQGSIWMNSWLVTFE